MSKISDPYYSNIKEAIKKLTENPRPRGCKKLKGRPSYRIRVGAYRIIYEVFDNELTVDVITIGYRKDVY